MPYRLLEESDPVKSPNPSEGRYRLLDEEENVSPKKSNLSKGARLGTQLGFGLAENALLPLEIGTAPLASKEAQHAEYRKGAFEDIERLMEQKQTGVWDEQDEALLKSLTDQVKNPQKAERFVKTADLSLRGLTEKATGLDLHPEGILEKAAHWTGFIKNPKNLKQLFKMGTNAKDLTKAIIPGKDALRGLGAGTALQMAEDERFGPMGTMGAMIVGDLIGAGVPALGRGLANPKKTLAKGAALLANSKSAIKKD